MEREGEVRKPRPPFDPASLALPTSFRFFVSCIASLNQAFLWSFGQTSFSHSNYQVDPLLRYAGKKKQGNIPGTQKYLIL